MPPPLGTHPWRIEENHFDQQAVAWRESLFALGNGELGFRGDFEEGYPQGVQGIEGHYWNGVYLRRPLSHGENAPGLAQWCDYMPALMNGRGLRITVNGQSLNTGRIVEHQRVLDLRSGLLTRSSRWRLPEGVELTVRVETLVSFRHSGCIAQRITLMASVAVELECCATLAPAATRSAAPDDPRINLDEHAVLPLEHGWHELSCMGAAQHTANARLSCGVTLSGGEWQPDHDDAGLSLRRQRSLSGAESWSFERHLLYRRQPLGDDITPADQQLRATLEQLQQAGYAALDAEQQADWRGFWQSCDLAIHDQPLVEQALRFNLFQLRQSCGRDGHASIAAKGLSGPGYDGHYFWDGEIYVLPLFSLLQPATAKALLRYRINTLEAARQRAREMSHSRGALFPWRTIGGGESSAYFPAGTAQYHINADIAHALWRYWQDSGDDDFLLDEAAEMLLDSARIWMELGHFNSCKAGRFTIHEVTGPDEYTAMVDNNYYTNLMASRHLRFAADVARRLREQRPGRWQQLARTLDLTETEVADWARAVAAIYLPVDETRGLSWQDDGFAGRPPWNHQQHPLDATPLLLKHHPLVLYRHQILKQADVLMAHYLAPEHSIQTRKRNDYDFYEPLTTHDSSLSACVHSILAAWLGRDDVAMDYFQKTLRTDLDNGHGNTAHGLHIAAMAGSLACLYHGYAGLRCDHQGVHLAPRLPPDWHSLRLRFHYRDSLLQLELRHDSCQLYLLRGTPPRAWLHGQPLTVASLPRLTETEPGDD
ncbi:MAG: glycosyl hydrolase family 65 protein [Wenzhouxiangellaceae bacterium]